MIYDEDKHKIILQSIEKSFEEERDDNMNKKDGYSDTNKKIEKIKDIIRIVFDRIDKFDKDLHNLISKKILTENESEQTGILKDIQKLIDEKEDILYLQRTSVYLIDEKINSILNNINVETNKNFTYIKDSSDKIEEYKNANVDISVVFDILSNTVDTTFYKDIYKNLVELNRYIHSYNDKKYEFYLLSYEQEISKYKTREIEDLISVEKMLLSNTSQSVVEKTHNKIEIISSMLSEVIEYVERYNTYIIDFKNSINPIVFKKLLKDKEIDDIQMEINKEREKLEYIKDNVSKELPTLLFKSEEIDSMKERVKSMKKYYEKIKNLKPEEANYLLETIEKEEQEIEIENYKYRELVDRNERLIKDQDVVIQLLEEKLRQIKREEVV